jgi:hypothetical protein
VPKFKYATTFLTKVKDCPPPQAIEAERIAFRFVSNPIDQSSFEVNAKLIPDRFAESPCCSACGLSMFTTEDEARIFFAKMAEKFRNFRKRSGGHLAEIALTKAHGVQTKPTKNGHFDLHEYVGVNLIPVAKAKGPL